MKKGKKIITLLLCFCLSLTLLGNNSILAYETTLPISENDGALSNTSNVIVGIDGTYTVDDITTALARINEIRKEACDNSFQYLDWSDNVVTLQPSDYVPMTWNTEFEKYARLRAAEATVNFDHTRYSNIKGPGLESLYAGTVSFLDAIEGWYSEKNDRLNTDFSKRGHYVNMIIPDMKSLGIGAFEATNGANATSMIFDTVAATNQAPLGPGGSVNQKIEVSSEHIYQVAIVGTSMLTTGETSKLETNVDMVFKDWGGNLITSDLIKAVTYSPITWSSSDPNIASIDENGIVTGNALGKVTITAQFADKVGSFEVTVKDITGFDDVNIVTESGTAPVMPSTVTGNWSDGTQSEESVVWDSMTSDQYSMRNGGSFTVNGTSRGKEVIATITVKPAFVLGVDGYNKAVTTESGTAPVLSTNGTINWSNGEVETLPIIWDAMNTSQYSPRLGGTFTVNGTVSGNDVSTVVTVNPAIPVNIKALADITTESGLAPNLVTITDVTWSNGEVTQENITWDVLTKDQYSMRDGGLLVAKGTVAGKEILCNVTVNPATIVSVDYIKEITVNSGIAPVLSNSASITWSNGDVEELPISWESMNVNEYKMRAGNEFDVNGTVDGLNVSTHIIVLPATIVSVGGYNKAVTTESGTAPVLSTNATIKWSNGDVEVLPITWDAIAVSQYSNRLGATFTVNGKVSGETVATVVTVNPAVPVKVTNVSEVTTESGTAPVMPTIADITWSNGEVTQENITWDQINKEQYSVRNGGLFTVNGTVIGLEVTCDVIVKPAIVTKLDYIKEIIVTSGTAPILSDEAVLTWSNGEVESKVIAWDAINASDYMMRAGNEFDVNGIVSGLNVSTHVIVTPSTIKEIGNYSKAVKTESGTAPKLPKTADIIWTNGDVETVNITWDPIDPALYFNIVGGIFEAKGKVTTILNGITIETIISTTVTVNKATVVSFESEFTAITESGVYPTLADYSKVTWSNGGVTEEKIEWNQIEKPLYSTINDSSFAVEGRIIGLDLVVKTNVKVNEAKIVNIEYLKDVITESGTAPVLSQLAKISWSNREATESKITWDQIDPSLYTNRLGNKFIVEGYLSILTDKLLDENVILRMAALANATEEYIKVTTNVTVLPAVIEKVDYIKEVETENSIGPKLSEKVEIIWSNGETTTEDIIWNNIDSKLLSIREGNEFIVKGLTKDSKLEVSTLVKVKAAEMVKYDNLEIVITTTSTAPKLSETVKVTWSNNEVTEEKVTWEKIDSANYSKVNEFTVNGTINGTFKVTQLVKVVELEKTQDPVIDEKPIDNNGKTPVEVNKPIENKDKVNKDTNKEKLPEAGTAQINLYLYGFVLLICAFAITKKKATK